MAEHSVRYFWKLIWMTFKMLSKYVISWRRFALFYHKASYSQIRRFRNLKKRRPQHGHTNLIMRTIGFQIRLQKLRKRCCEIRKLKKCFPYNGNKMVILKLNSIEWEKRAIIEMKLEIQKCPQNCLVWKLFILYKWLIVFVSLQSLQIVSQHFGLLNNYENLSGTKILLQISKTEQIFKCFFLWKTK